MKSYTRFLQSWLCKVFLVLTPAIASAEPRGVSAPDAQVTIATLRIDPTREGLRRLIELGFEIAGVDRKAHTTDVILHNIDDLRVVGLDGLVIETKVFEPSIAPDSGYQTPDKIKTTLHMMATSHPDIMRIESVGKSLEGRDVWAALITKNPQTHDPKKPVILFNAMHHAREVMTSEVALDIIAFLTTRHGQDARVQQWLTHNEIWVIPMVNPDGNNRVWTQNTMWRKNARGGYGVDLNRNYPQGWNSCSGSSGNIYADNYRGTAPASEPETQALMAFAAKIQPVFSISYHSYSELVLYPYGCAERRTPIFDVVEGIGHEMANLLMSDSGQGTYDPGTPWELLYNADGGDIDWLYHELHVIPFVIEVNSSSQGFQPSYSWREPTVQKMRPAWMLLLDKLEKSGIRGNIVDQDGHPLPAVNITVQNLAAPASSVTWASKKDGSYHFVLKPGNYRLSFLFMGQEVQKEVSISGVLEHLDIKF